MTPDDPLLGKTIDGRYVLRRRIGRGGMGVVYEAEHAALDRRVAIKLIAAKEATEAYLERFRREAKLASRITHEHLVHIYDVGRDEATGADYIVMELVEGRDLGRELEAGPIGIARATGIATQMLAGLGAIHAAGIIHRDIKPQNVMLTTRAGERDFVKLMDFGIARAVGDASLTVTGHVMGTPSFMSPEQLRGKPVDHRTDLYAVGVTLFAMIAGKLPFDGKNTAELAGAHVFQEPPSLATVRPDTPAHLVAAVARALAKAPEQRFPDAAAFAAALGGAPRRRVPALALALLLLVALGGGAIAAYLATRSSEPPAAAPVAVRSDPPKPAPPPPVAVDAAVVVIADTAIAVDASAPIKPQTKARPPDSPVGPIGRCQCIPTDAPDVIALCAEKGATRCRCDLATGKSLCPMPLVEDKWCRPDNGECFPNGYRCPDRQFAAYHLPGRADEPCEGYEPWLFGEPNRAKLAGHYECDVCAGAKLDAFRGRDGDPCTGFYWRTGDQKAGKLAHCQ